MARNSVLVTDGYWRKSLAAVRALARKGLNVGIGERTVWAPALFSKYAKWRYVYPSVARHPTEFMGWLRATIEKGKFDVLITPEEETELLVAKNKEMLSRFVRLPIADYQKIAFLRDKYRIVSYAHKVDIPCPVSRLISSARNIDKKPSHFTYPLVLKPRMGSGARGLRYIHNLKDLEWFSQEALKKYGSFLLQEYIPGEDYYGVSVIFNERNELRSAFVHKKIRQYPVTGGVSTYAVSVHYPELVRLSEKILKSIGWYGVANIEFKIDNRDGRPKLMEINPRLWGSLHLAVESGINFPYLLYQLALRGDIKPAFDYAAGIKFRWLLPGDMMRFISMFIKYQNIDWSFFRFYERDMHYAILSLKDPLPVLGRILSLIDYLVNKEMKKFTSEEMRKFRG